MRSTYGMVDVLRRIFSFFPWRRANARPRRAIAIDWHLFGSAVHHRCDTGDLTARGAFVRTLRPAPAGSPIVLTLDDAPVHARVAWSNARGMGLRFTRPRAQRA